MNLILLAIPFFFIGMGIEYWYSRKKDLELYSLNDTLTNLLVGIGQQISNLFQKILLIGLFIFIYENYRFFTLPTSWWTILLSVIMYDFLFYWAHRWAHEVNLFWGAHVVHHQSEEYNLSVALRQSWFHNMFAFFIFLPIPLIGFSPVAFGIGAGIQTLYQFWIHTRAVGKLHPWLEYIMNTPSHHRVHHAINPKYIDKNHGGVFIIWDRIFGTYAEEEESIEITYGITTQLKSWNPLWANLHYYSDLFKSAKRFTNVGDKLRIIFARPGWLPEYMGGYQAPQEVDRNEYKKYRTESPVYLKVYSIVQFLFALGGSIAYMYHFDHLSTFYKVVFLAVIILSMLIISGIFENKRWVFIAEYVRLVGIGLSLNTLYFFWYEKWFSLVLIISLVALAAFVGFFTASLVWQLKEDNQLAAQKKELS